MAAASGHKHTCQYTGVDSPCAACLANPVRAGMDPRDVKAMQQISKYKNRTDVECNTLPLHTPGADSYSPLGKPRFSSLRKLRYVGERYGLNWV